MTKQSRVLAAALTVSVLALLVGAVAQLQAAPLDGSKKIQIACKHGWRGSAAGTYGGVPFSIGCDNDRSMLTLDGAVGTSYSARMGVEEFGGAYDCFYSGDARNVNESCAGVRLTIR